jgi:hypothetical protein
MRILIFITVAVFFSSCSRDIDGKLAFFEANPESGYNYPFFLFVPEETSKEDLLTLIMEPNNSGFVDDDFQKHIDKAERIATLDFYIGNYLSRNLGQPLLVPVFPRSRNQWQLYTHALDRDVMLQKNTSLERMDIQLINMVANAQSELKQMGYQVDKQVFMAGFSASGTFANRFTVLHPDRVKAMAAGGINGLLILPLDSLDDRSLNYPVGVNDFRLLTGDVFKKEEFAATPQFLYMGAMDDNDAIPYEDGYSLEERELIFDLLGGKMMPDRWQTCIKVYQSHSVNAIFKTFEETGHEQSSEIKGEVLKFFESELNHY